MAQPSLPKRKTVESLRSQRWLAPDSMRAFSHRARLAQTGWNRNDFMNRPVIGILNTWSDISTCHSHLRERAQKVREGVIRAGGWPIELPAMSLGEVWVKPTTMLYRNFLAMEAEELIRCHPIDGVVLMGGCDKTTPALLMGAFSVNLPCIFIPAGASANGSFRGQKVGTGTHTMKFWNEKRAGKLDDDAWQELEGCMTRHARHLQHRGHGNHDDGGGRKRSAFRCPARIRFRRRTAHTSACVLKSVSESSTWCGKTLHREPSLRRPHFITR